MTDTDTDTATALPSARGLWGCWAILMTMTAVSLWAGDPADSLRRLPMISVAVLMAAAGVKSVQILWVFLDLRRSTLTWKATFLGLLATLLAILLGCAAVGLWLGR